MGNNSHSPGNNKPLLCHRQAFSFHPSMLSKTKAWSTLKDRSCHP